MVSTTEMLLSEHRAHKVAVAVHEAAHPSIFAAALSTPEPPQPSVYAEAGERIAEVGAVRAAVALLAYVHTHTEVSDRMREIALLVHGAANEALGIVPMV